MDTSLHPLNLHHTNAFNQPVSFTHNTTNTILDPNEVVQKTNSLQEAFSQLLQYNRARAGELDKNVTISEANALDKYASVKNNPNIADFVDFIKKSPTAWQATDNVIERLTIAGFKRLNEDEHWKIVPGQSYFVERNGSSLIAFQVPVDSMTHATIMGAHTDSPALKLKPNPEVMAGRILLLSPEVYGGPLLPTWLNRELTIAGVVYYLDESKNLRRLSVNLEETIAIVAELAVHLDREKGKKTELNPKKDLHAFVGTDIPQDYAKSYVANLIREKYGVEILEGSELFLVPNQPPIVWGAGNISSYRLDNLAGCHSSLLAFLNTLENPSAHQLKMITLWNDEEHGSQTDCGAMSPFMNNTLERLYLSMNMDREDQIIFERNSYIISNDVAHAFNPNYADKYDSNHKLFFGDGVAIKSNANQRYATNAHSQSMLEAILKNRGDLRQYFSADNVVGCGTTVGPVNAALTGIPTIDVGELVLTMHGTREIGNCKDHLQMIDALTHVFEGRENVIKIDK